MPTYDFYCKDCDHEFEQLLLATVDGPKPSDIEQVPCELCGKPATKFLAQGKRYLRFHFNYMEP